MGIRKFGPWAAILLGLGLTVGVAPAGAQQGTPRNEAASDQVVPVTAIGKATYRPDDMARSRDEAVEAARRDAIEQVSGVFISSESELRNYDLVRDDVLSRSEGYLKSSKILREGVVDHLYQVQIEAQVVKGAFLRQFHDSLAELYQRVGKPRLMMALNEHTGPDACASQPSAGDQGVGARELRKMLLSEGFTFVDPRVASQDQLREVQAKGKGADPNALIQLGLATKAEILILGDVKCADMGVVDRFHRAQAWMSLDVLRADNGQVLASQTSNSIGVQVTDDQAKFVALQKTAQDMVPQLIQQITYQWIKEKNEGSTIQLVVHDASYDDLIQLRKVLANEVRGVKRVTQRSYGPGGAELALTSRDSSDRLAEAIRAAKYPDFTLEIVNVTPSTVVVNFKKSSARQAAAAPQTPPQAPPAARAPASPSPAAPPPVPPAAPADSSGQKAPADSSALAPPTAIPAPQSGGEPTER